MTGSLLSWDDLDEDPIITKARESIANLDTTAAIQELDAQRQVLDVREQIVQAGAQAEARPQERDTASVINHNTKPVVLSFEGAKTALARAQLAVAEYSKDFVPGERILAKNKRLINAQTDLNQLIPFKYAWAWSMYLESTNAHWMPGEIEGYLKDITEYKALDPKIDIQRVASAMVSRLAVNYMYSQAVYPPQITVNLYRLSTNPEVRQYQLRQAFEEQVYHHSVRHMVEVFELERKDILKHRIDESAWQERNREIAKSISILHQLDADTVDVNSLGDFIVALATVYGGLRALYHLVPTMQLWQLNRDHNLLKGVSDNIVLIWRDLQRQYDFGLRYISGVISENPTAWTDDVKHRIAKVMNTLHTYNEDFASTLSDGSADNYKEVVYCSKRLSVDFCRQLGIDVPEIPKNPKYEKWMALWASLNTVDHNNAATTLTGSTGGGLTDW